MGPLIKPLRNNLIVRLVETTKLGIIVPMQTEKWKLAKSQIGNRGVVVKAGPGKRNKKGVLRLPQIKIGDSVQFSELRYPTFIDSGVKYAIISDNDVVVVY